jgi:hypothetical protein
MKKILCSAFFYGFASTCHGETSAQHQLIDDASPLLLLRARNDGWSTQGVTDPSAHMITPNAIPFGVLSISDLGKVLADVAALRGWGYIGDGGSHPLSTVARFNGANSSGWTLTRWQMMLPTATALTDEIDGEAINSYIAAATGPVRLQIPAGSARLSHPVSSCAQSVSISGFGMQQSTLNFINSDGWDHCQSSGTDTKIEAHNIEFNSLTIGGSLFGIKAKFVPDVNVYLDNVRIIGFNSCMSFTHVGGARIKDSFCFSAQPAGVPTLGDGIAFSGQTSFDNHIYHTLVQNYSTAFKFTSTNTLPTIGIEDVSLSDDVCGGVKKCVEILATDPGYSPFAYSIINMTADATTQFVNADQVSDLVIHGGSWIVDPPVGSWTGATSDFFRFRRVLTAKLERAWITNNATAVTINSYIHVLGTTPASDVFIGGNKFEYLNLTVSAAQIDVDSAAQAVIFDEGNTFTSFFTPTLPPANAFSWGPVNDTLSWNSWINPRVHAPLLLRVYTLAAGVNHIPACSPAFGGAMAVVSDAAMPTYGAPALSGGTNIIPVLCNTVAWVAH